VTDFRWVSQAPKRINPIVVASVSQVNDDKIPGISIAFQAIKEADMTTVTLIGSEFELRKFQKDIDRAITMSLREVR
jgi:hypothetical protein